MGKHEKIIQKNLMNAGKALKPILFYRTWFKESLIMLYSKLNMKQLQAVGVPTEYGKKEEKFKQLKEQELMSKKVEATVYKYFQICE